MSRVAAGGDLFGLGFESSSGFSVEADEYLRAKFAQSKSGAPVPKKTRAKPPRAAAPEPPPQSAELLDADELELLGGAPPAAARAVQPPATAGDEAAEGAAPAGLPAAEGRAGAACTANAAARSSEPLIQAIDPASESLPGRQEPVEELELEAPPGCIPQPPLAPPEPAEAQPSRPAAVSGGAAVAAPGSSSVYAARLAAPGTEHATARVCPEGHALLCYVVAWSCAICDECDTMQRPGEVVYGCKTCDSELCAGCVVATAPSPEQAQVDQEVIERVSQKKQLPGGPATRFVATPSGDVLDVAPASSSSSPLRPTVAAEGRRAAAIVDRPVAPAEEAADVAAPEPPRCPAGECLMAWTEQAKHFGYFCCGCGSMHKGARWRCTKHKTDKCPTCHAPPPGAALSPPSRRAAELDEPCRRKGGAVAAAGSGRSAAGRWLDEMLAEQEHLILGSSLDVREADEAQESLRPDARNRSARPPAPAGAAGGDVAPDGAEDAAGRAGPCTGGLMDEDAARQRPLWAVEGRAPPPVDAAPQPFRRTMTLTLTLIGDFIDELTRGYSQPWFQELVHACARECSYERVKFLARLQDIAFEVQRPILENWGFEGNAQGVYDMTCIFREYLGSEETGEQEAPAWLRERIDRCLALLYGGAEGGMLSGG